MTGFSQFVTVPANETVQVTGDPEDNYVLATCRLARADYLVTGDRGLLQLGAYEGTRIVTPRDFFLEVVQRDGG